MIKAFALGTDGKFHECRVLGVCSSLDTLFPKVMVIAVKGFPFNDNRTALIEMRASLFYYESGCSSDVCSVPRVMKTAGLDSFIRKGDENVKA